MGRQSEYFEDLLNADQKDSSGVKDKGTSSEQGNCVTEAISVFVNIFSVYEVTEAVSALQNGKATGIDEIRPEMVKHSGMPGILWLHRIVKLAWETGLVPGD
ncbi:hypothetical protein JGG87_25315 [Salmonella enterica subsp. enterica serovar Typhimurium]|nr:hypothetical protein [Salmonella enterica subsp. enterica serovar Typhimurium]